MKALVVSGPVTDIIERGDRRTIRPGGPALYAGAALNLLGYTVQAIGSWGYMNMCTIRAERKLGVQRLSSPVPGPGGVFRLIYHGRNRKASPFNRPPSINGQELRRVHHEVYDIVVVSPVYDEVPPTLLPLLRPRKFLALDVQGYARSGLAPAIPRGVVTLAHASGEESRLIDNKLAYITVLTNGYGPIDVVIAGKKSRVLDKPPGEPIDDPTGAGDVFLALLADRIARGTKIIDAVHDASLRVPRILDSIRSELSRIEC